MNISAIIMPNTKTPDYLV